MKKIPFIAAILAIVSLPALTAEAALTQQWFRTELEEVPLEKAEVFQRKGEVHLS